MNQPTTRCQTYVDYVLAPTYSFTRDHYFTYILEISIAHIQMLRRQKIIPDIHASTLVEATTKLYETGWNKPYNAQFEDLFFMIEHDLSEKVGDEVVGNMHVAFSRNDMDATMYRMFWRERVVEWMNDIHTLADKILKIANGHTSAYMPAYTHHQQAQPTTLAHYFMSVASNLQRDVERGWSLLTRIDQSPMGACALGTTGHPIDRTWMSDSLGFERVLTNSYDAVSASDYMIELASVLTICMSSMSRVVYDLLQMTMNEVNTFRLGDLHVQTSSIMPQKRNPSALEHTRAMMSDAMGVLNGVPFMSHHVPHGDIVDIGDDIQPKLLDGFTKVTQAIQLLEQILDHGTFHTDVLYDRAANGFSTVTELADVLVRDGGLSFREAHLVVQTFVKSTEKLSNGNVKRLQEAGQRVGVAVNLSQKQYEKAIDVASFIDVRKVQGGPAPVAIREHIRHVQEALINTRTKVNQKQEGFTTYRTKLFQRTANEGEER
ncbi:argininosuccinate lyase [Geomicrobium sp. JSM 1781026]|uniref:argininosuccinate lyase n=1 Tax=Geomicrobium sp. JSM 1781026 TaxID=3344580 RepID=UPI0035C2611B